MLENSLCEEGGSGSQLKAFVDSLNKNHCLSHGHFNVIIKTFENQEFSHITDLTAGIFVKTSWMVVTHHFAACYFPTLILFHRVVTAFFFCNFWKCFFFNTKTYFSPSQKIWLYLTNYAPIGTELEWIDKFSHFADDESAVTVMNKLQTNLYVYKVSQSKNNWKYPCNIWSCQIWKPQGSLCLEVRAKNRCICSAQNEH